ncbi:hypothetical protein HG531_006096 [Fusarium graminearum]|nr:hypothetical protein HG531_006096 [Fusarium graminearum]
MRSRSILATPAPLKARPPYFPMKRAAIPAIARDFETWSGDVWFKEQLIRWSPSGEVNGHWSIVLAGSVCIGFCGDIGSSHGEYTMSDSAATGVEGSELSFIAS